MTPATLEAVAGSLFTIFASAAITAAFALILAAGITLFLNRFFPDI